MKRQATLGDFVATMRLDKWRNRPIYTKELLEQFEEDLNKYMEKKEELGYIGDYRWGVEYPTNGKKPDLDSSILVYVVDCHAPYSKEAQVIDIHWPRYDTFEIIDERYKPADTSYLDAPTVKESLPDEWYDYDSQKAIALPPVGEKVETCNAEHLFYGVGERGEVLAHVENTAVIRMSYGLGCFVADNLRPLDYNRKAEAEKDALINAATDILYKHACATKGELIDGAKALYEAGYLVLPQKV